MGRQMVYKLLRLNALSTSEEWSIFGAIAPSLDPSCTCSNLAGVRFFALLGFLVLPLALAPTGSTIFQLGLPQLCSRMLKRSSVATNL